MGACLDLRLDTLSCCDVHKDIIAVTPHDVDDASSVDKTKGEDRMVEKQCGWASW
jgi:hypothetical protein